MRCAALVPLVRLSGALLVLAACPAVAQIVEVPTFQVGTASFSAFLQGVDVATHPDGTMVFMWGEYGWRPDTADFAVTRWFSPQGLPLGPAVRVDIGLGRFPKISADTRGGYVGSWFGLDYPIVGRRLDGSGVGVGNAFRASCEIGTVISGSVAGLPSGSVFIYDSSGLHGCLFDTAGQPRGGFLVGRDGYSNAVAALRDGGFVVVWFDIDTSRGRIYDPDGQPRGDPFVVSTIFGAMRVAVSPLGGFAVAGSRWNADYTAVDVWARRFADDGTPLGDDILVLAADAGLYTEPDIEFDLGGDLYVAWDQFVSDTGHGRRPQARVYDPSGNPLGPPFFIADELGVGLRTTRLASGSLVNAWYWGGQAWANVLSLCTPGVAVCGDSVVVAQCEQCDDGGANSDTTPDACRSDCRLARCGDGVVDSGEECDDGNLRSCDGCSAQCRVEVGFVCGDGVMQPACGETCDDGNQIAGDGCSPQCTLERIPGGGKTRTDCYAEWIVDNPTNVPFRDATGAINLEQRCVDDDPRCDFDGGTPGGCTFHVQVCTNNTDLPACQPGTRLAGWELLSPSAAKAAVIPPYTTLRADFAAAVTTLIGPTTRDVCTAAVAVPVPLRGVAGAYRPGKLKLKSVARLYTDATDKDQLKLNCLPASP